MIAYTMAAKLDVAAIEKEEVHEYFMFTICLPMSCFLNLHVYLLIELAYNTTVIHALNGISLTSLNLNSPVSI